MKKTIPEILQGIWDWIVGVALVLGVLILLDFSDPYSNEFAAIIKVLTAMAVWKIYWKIMYPDE